MSNTKTFNDFNTNTAPLTGDFLIGVCSDGSAEFKTTIGTLLSGVGRGVDNVYHIDDTSKSIAPVNGDNVAEGNYSVVSGGRNNCASAEYGNATISGGHNNIANGTWNPTIGGGSKNVASGSNTTVSGGYCNHAYGYHATVGGGTCNSATGGNSTVAGGWCNVAGVVNAININGTSGECSDAVNGYTFCGQGGPNPGQWYLVGGEGNSSCITRVESGCKNCWELCNNHAVAVTHYNDNYLEPNSWHACDGYTTGTFSTDRTYDSTSSGGYCNIAIGNADTIAGGVGNITSGADETGYMGGEGRNYGGANTISGGLRNFHAYGSQNTISGGYENIIFGGTGSTISGGYNNYAGGFAATTGGGIYNSANYDDSTVGGGCCNVADGYSVTISGGTRNCAESEGSTISGGCCNYVSYNNSDNSSIGGGSNNQSGIACTLYFYNEPTSQLVGLNGPFYKTDDRTNSSAFCNFGTGSCIYKSCNSNIYDSWCVYNDNTGYKEFEFYDYSYGRFCNLDFIYSRLEEGYPELYADDYSSNTYSATIGGGLNNVIACCAATVAGGKLNEAIGCKSVVSGGRSNCAIGGYAVIGGGCCNVAYGDGDCTTIGGGEANTSWSGYGATIAGGRYNNIGAGWAPVIGGGQDNCVSGGSSTVSGGKYNCVGGYLNYDGSGNSDCYTCVHAGTIGGGGRNLVSGNNGTISGGYCNKISGSEPYYDNGISECVCPGVNSTVSGGYYNHIRFSCNSVIGGGCDNTIHSNHHNSSILGGYSNHICHSNAHIVGSGVTSVSANFTYVNALEIADSDSSIILKDANGKRYRLFVTTTGQPSAIDA